MHPIAFKLGTWDLHWYGVLVALGFLAGLWTAGRRAPRMGLTPDQVGDATVWVVVGTILGARTLYVATYWKEKFAGESVWEVFKVWHGGLVFYGGLIGSALAVILFCRFRRVPLWKLADVLAPSIALGYVFGRMGCLMNGCCYGRTTALPWGITYPPNSEICRAEGSCGPVHPTQIYDSLLNLGLYLFLAWLARRKKFDGQVFAVYLICYAFTRSFVEYFRGDYDNAHRHGLWTPAQLVSVIVFATGLTLAVALRQRSLKLQTTKSK